MNCSPYSPNRHRVATARSLNQKKSFAASPNRTRSHGKIASLVSSSSVVASAGAKQPIVVSCEDLYAQVWSTPMRDLATQYGITGTGLAKICARLNVPCPPRGYWAKKRAAKPVVQFRLPERAADTPQKVTIGPTPVPPPPVPIQLS